MLSSVIPAILVTSYLSGLFFNVSYRLMRLAEIKHEHDLTRSKDIKNDCMNLARFHVQELGASWAWPISILDLSAFRWGQSLDKK